MAILLVASQAFELKPVAGMLTGLRKLKWPLDYAYEGIWESRRILLAANGLGPKLSAHAVEMAVRAAMSAELSSSRLEAVISTGLCGALDPNLREGQIIVASEILSPSNGERYPCAEVAGTSEFISGPILSQDAVANNPKQKQLLRNSGALAVEMEAAGVAARTNRAGLPFACIKIVSDRADESFPLDLNSMRTQEGRIDRGKIILHALAHPKSIPSLFRWKRRAEDAAAELGEFLVGCRIVTEPAGAGSGADQN